MNKKPKVSVLMPAYNAQDYIGEAIESILNQSFADFEFIIVDDCSTDKTWQIIKDYSKKDKRIKPFKNKKNSGVTLTLNNGLKKCSGEYIARMDSDDISMSQRLEKQISYMEKNNIDVLGANIIFIDENGKSFGKRKYSKNIKKTIKLESPLAHPTVVFRKKLIDKFGGYEPEFNSAEDYDLWLRLWLKGARISILNMFLLKYRQHRDTIKQTKTKKTLKTTIKVKLNAYKNYGLRPGIKGWLRLMAEASLIVLPKDLILGLFYFFTKQRNR